MKNMHNETLLKPNEVAKMLHVSPVTVRQWAATNKLPCKQTPGGHRRFAIDDVREFLEQQSVTSDQDSITILIIDDDRMHYQFLEEAIKHLLPHVSTAVASNGFEAGDLLHKSKPDVVLLDIIMPGIDGFAVCQRIKSSSMTCHIPVIAMTGYPSDENIQRIIAAGAETCLRKPIRMDMLRDLLSKHIQQFASIADADGA